MTSSNRTIGWLLDISIEQDHAIIWIKTIEGNILKLIDFYQPSFYVLPKSEAAGVQLFQILSQQSAIKSISWDEKYTDLFTGINSMKKLICVCPTSIQTQRLLVNKLEKDSGVDQLFNTDMLHVQQYLFTALKIEPTSKVEVEYQDSKIVKITKIDDEAVIQPPPFSLSYFEIITFSDFGNALDNAPIKKITVQTKDEQHISFEGPEEAVLQNFCYYVIAQDPDILICVTRDNKTASSIFQHLFNRAKELGFNLQLGRESNDIERHIEGRILLRSSSLLDEFGLVGLVERSRFSFLPLGLAAQYGINRLIDSRNCYEHIQKGFAISKNNFSHQHERIRTLEEIVSRDKGGIIFSPQIGLHENVAVLDYDSEYANLILKHNLSYETVVYPGIVLQNIDKGLLPTVLESVLNRRLYFKNIKQELEITSPEWLWCDQRMAVLKNILVCLYGTTGSMWNRYANVLAFEEINKISREVLIKTKDIVQHLGFELVYADTDSVFLKKEGTSIKDYENVVEILIKETGLPISLEQHYKFLILLPLEADEKMEALKHYFGITDAGELIARGIELRRHDTPNFLKEFQTELLHKLFDCENSNEVMSKGYEKALLLVTRTIDRIMTNDIQLHDLVVSKLLGQQLHKYKALFPHVSAAIQLSKAGKPTMVGEGVEYIHTNAHHTNPLCRVKPSDFIRHGEGLDYDKEKYREMLLEATETVLGFFGFDRSIYGDTAKKKYRKWWHTLREDRARDIDSETLN